MWHVADGDLHAYLDGALDLYPGADAQRVRSHLEACGECRLRLEEEARIRDAAAGVLARTAPGPVEVPPFEALRRRSAVGDAPSGRSGRPALLAGLGWAASVVLALGVGWMAGRGADEAGPAAASMEPPAPAVVDRGGTPAVSAEAGPAPALGDAAAEAPEARGAPVVVAADDSSAGEWPAGAGAEAGGPAELETLTEAELRDRVRAAAEPEVSPMPVEGPPARTALEGDAATPGGTIVGRVLRDGTGAPLVSAQVSVEGTGLGSLTDEDGRYVLRGVPPGTRTLRLDLIGHQAASETVTVTGGDTAVVDLSSSPTAVALNALTVTGAPGDSAPGSSGLPDSLQFARAPADAVAEAPPTPPRLGTGDASARGLAIPGLEVVRVEWAEVAPGREGLVVVQRLAADTTRLELRFGGLQRSGVQRRARDPSLGRAPPALLEESLPEGVNQVWAPLRDGGWVVLRGRFGTDRLQRLLDLVR